MARNKNISTLIADNAKALQNENIELKERIKELERLVKDAEHEKLRTKAENAAISSVSARLYSMKLHEEIQDKGYGITRVASGWIYKTNREGSDVFVPFDNKFQDVR